MAVKIRLSRTGRKKQPHYSIVVIDSRKATKGKAIAIIGHYHPLQSENNLHIDEPIFNKYISFGAIPSETVTKLAIKLNIESVKKFEKSVTRKSHNHGKSRKQIKEESKK